jgi:polygalacturonase
MRLWSASHLLILLYFSSPSAGAPIFDVLTFGAKGDGISDDGDAITKAYAACSASGGGTVLFRSGKTFATGPLTLKCNDSVTVIQSDAKLVSRNTTDGWPYGLDSPEPAQGKTAKQMAPLLMIQNGRNMTFHGGGTIDANGEMWWEHACGNWWCPPGHTSKDPYAFRPFLFRIDGSVDINLENLTVTNPGFWCIVPVHSQKLRMVGLTITAKRTHPASPTRTDLLNTPNTDGIEPMWTQGIENEGLFRSNNFL